MKKIILTIFSAFIFLNAVAQPRPVKLSSTIIIDTDCAFDDMIAISLLLARREITIKAIVVSDGSLAPEDGSAKVLSLLNEFNRTEIPVIRGSVLKAVNPGWRTFCKSIRWGKRDEGQISAEGAADYLLSELRNEKEKLTIVCLGPLTNIAAAIKNDGTITGKIGRIVWYNESAKPPKGFNYECDKKSADFILGSKIRIDIISNLGKEGARFDNALVNVAINQQTKLARVLNYVFSQPAVIEKLKENHFSISDELTAVYLTNPELFSINTDLEKLSIRYNKDYDVNSVREVIIDMITGEYTADRNVVFNSFPENRQQFSYDIRPIIDSAIARYGYEEWKANVMTDEFHGHLGVFSIVGAKMGIRAREIFGVGPDMLDVTTFAGSKPPYSCLTDGIQVSTGATLGMGTIHPASDPKAQPSAIFTYKDRSVKITLKKEYLDKVDADINEGIMKFGLMDDGYWKLIRHNALKYWLEWDRNKIFDIEEISINK